MIYKIIKGSLIKEHVEDKDLLVIGDLKSDIIKCKTLIILGHITVRKLVMCENALIIGSGRIYSMISKNTVLIPTTSPILVNNLKTIELLTRGKRYPAIIHEV